MCGRYTLHTEVESWVDLDIPWLWNEDFDWSPNYNIAPGTMAPVVCNLERPTVALHRWGLVPHWAKDPKIGHRMINARAETLQEKPAFREAFRRRRCLVLADGFYEWKRQGKAKIPHYLRLRSQRVFSFAGLWERWQGPGGEPLNSFTIITTEPNEVVAPIHQRMPVILHADTHRLWLSPEPREPRALAHLLAPCPSDALEAYPVSQMVNHPSNNTEQCIRPANLT